MAITPDGHILPCPNSQLVANSSKNRLQQEKTFDKNAHLMWKNLLEVLPPTCNCGHGCIPAPVRGLRLVTARACEPGKWLCAAASCYPPQANNTEVRLKTASFNGKLQPSGVRKAKPEARRLNFSPPWLSQLSWKTQCETDQSLVLTRSLLVSEENFCGCSPG